MGTTRAIAAMQSILSEDIRQVSTYFNLGQVQDRAGRTDDAIASYRRVVDAAPVLGMNTTLSLTRLALGRLLNPKATPQARKSSSTPFESSGRADADFDP